MTDSKRILIPWSGGADSTILVASALRTNQRVWYCVFHAGQPHTQIEAESIARTRLEDKLKTMYPDAPELRLHRSMLTLDTSGTKLPMKQLPAWFMHLITMVADDGGNFYFDEIQLGYLLNDDAAYAATHLKLAWRHLCLAIYGIDKNPPELKFPLLRFRKGDVLHELNQLGLMDMVSVCELPQLYDEGWRMCEQCPSCHKHNKAMAERELHMGMRHRGDLLVDYDHRTKNEVHETLNNTYVKEEDLRCEQTS